MVMYHGSPISEIEVFMPRMSTHGKSLVYAAKSMDSVILYCAKWNDFQVTCGSDDVIVERYQGALDELYKNKKGYIYILDGSAFKFDEHCNDFVSNEPVKVIECVTINNLYDVVMAKYNVFKYPNKPSWVPDDDSDIISHAIKIVEMCGDKGVFEYVKTKFPHLEVELKEYLR